MSLGIQKSGWTCKSRTAYCLPLGQNMTFRETDAERFPRKHLDPKLPVLDRMNAERCMELSS